MFQLQQMSSSSDQLHYLKQLEEESELAAVAESVEIVETAEVDIQQVESPLVEFAGRIDQELPAQAELHIVLAVDWKEVFRILQLDSVGIEVVVEIVVVAVAVAVNNLFAAVLGMAIDSFVDLEEVAVPSNYCTCLGTGRGGQLNVVVEEVDAVKGGWSDKG